MNLLQGLKCIIFIVFFNYFKKNIKIIQEHYTDNQYDA